LIALNICKEELCSIAWRQKMSNIELIFAGSLGFVFGYLARETADYLLNRKVKKKSEDKIY